MTWELREVEDIECTLDDSGVYTVIHRIKTRYGNYRQTPIAPVHVRLDLITASVEPLMSWQGTANNVRKAVIAFLDERNDEYYCCDISAEHASYIGYELHRAETDPNYVQD